MTTDRVGPVSAGGVRIERVAAPADRTAGQAWVVGDDEECVVVAGALDAAPLLRVVGRRRLTAVLWTQAHADPDGAIDTLLEAHPRARLGVHADDAGQWAELHPGQRPSLVLTEADTITVGDIELRVLHTPGSSPGACCFHAPDLGVVFTGDTEPGERLLALDPDTIAYPGSGPSTTIATLRAHRPT